MLIVTLALLSSCDRYEHNYTTPVGTDYAVELFTPLQTAFNQSNANDISPVMAHYADDYLHFGISKSEWELELRTLITGVANPMFEVIMGSAMQQNETNAIANWQLRISDPDSKRVIADSTFVGERLVKRGSKWLLKGNQMICEPPAGKQLVIAEYFTYLSCNNCPPAEEKLKELQLQYPQNFVYLEQHTSGDLQIVGDTTPSYYAAYSPPVTVFNGMVKVTQSVPASLAIYQSQVDELVTLDTPIRYQVQSAPVINGRELSGSVQLTPLIALDQSEMQLHYVIIEEESPYSNTTTPNVKLHNVVQARGSVSLSGVNLASPISFSLTSPRDLPEDIRLIVFAQKRPSPFQNNATIYGGLDIPLLRKGAK
jgi:hypothetical protein